MTATPDGDIRRRRAQAAVWDAVEQQSTARGSRSDTAALEDVHETTDAGVRGALGRLVPVPGQTGVAFTTGEAMLGMDLFDRPETLADYLPALAAGYALEAGAPVSRHPAAVAKVALVELFMSDVAHATRRRLPAVGLGRDIVLAMPNFLTGRGLVHGPRWVHLAAFPEPAGVYAT